MEEESAAERDAGMGTPKSFHPVRIGLGFPVLAGMVMLFDGRAARSSSSGSASVKGLTLLAEEQAELTEANDEDAVLQEQMQCSAKDENGLDAGCCIGEGDNGLRVLRRR